MYFYEDLRTNYTNNILNEYFCIGLVMIIFGLISLKSYFKERQLLLIVLYMALIIFLNIFWLAITAIPDY